MGACTIGALADIDTLAINRLAVRCAFYRVLTLLLLRQFVSAGACRVSCVGRPAALCRAGLLACVALRARPQALQFVDCLRDEWVREGDLGRHPRISLPLDAFLQISKKES